MARPLPVDYLQPDEEPLHATGRHPLSVLDELLWALVLLAAFSWAVWFGLRTFVPALWAPLGIPALVGAGVAYVLLVVTRVWRVQTSRYIITAERTYKSHGRLRFDLMQTTYDKVTDLHVRQSLFGRLWGFGTVRLETAGTGIALDGVRDPFGYKQRIEEARSGFLHMLVAKRIARPGPDPAQGPKAERTHRTLWTGGPNLASFLGSSLRAALFFLVGAGFLLRALAGDTQFVFIGGGLLAFAVLILASNGVRFRCTHYLVEDWGVVVTSGWLSRRRVETTYAKVTDVTVYQGIVGRVLGYGNITINTAGSNVAPVVFHGLADPERVKATIDEARREAGS